MYNLNLLSLNSFGDKNKPAKATISFVERPTALKLEMRRLRLEVGVGMLLLAAPWLAVLASLLPNFTSQLGPPSYIYTSKILVSI